MDLGPRVRTLRQKAGITQVGLAKQLGISPSYLNLIEHGRRPLPAALLIKVAKVFELDLHAFAEHDPAQLTTELAEVFSDDILVGHSLADAEVAEFAQRSPHVARAVTTLYEAYLEAQEALQSMASRAIGQGLAEGVTGVEPWRLPSEEVSDLLQRNENYFQPLETAAAALWVDADLQPHRLFGRLRDYVHQRLGIVVQVEKAQSMDRTVRKYDPETKTLYLSEVLPPHTVVFQIAHQIALVQHGALLDRMVAEDKQLTTPNSRSLARVALANYYAGAVLMPYDDFAAAARELRYDVDMLGRRFRASFEQVCHRLTTLQRPGSEGIPFHFIRVDVAGNISKRFSASGITFARFSGACPRWNLVNCFTTPGQIRVQLSQMADGKEYFCIARTVSRGERGFSSPAAMHAVCLGCSVEHARELIYSDGIDVENIETAVPVGVTCRLCDRMDCDQRAFPPMQRHVHIDENIRAQSFYASLKT